MVEQLVQCVFDGAGEELPLQVYREKARAGVDVFVTRHGRLRNFTLRLTLIFVLVHGTMRRCLDFFYSFVGHHKNMTPPIDNAAKLIERFGAWPPFHDAEVLRVEMGVGHLVHLIQHLCYLRFTSGKRQRNT